MGSDLCIAQLASGMKDTALVEIVGEHLFKNLADDPRYKAFLRKMNLPTGGS